MGLSKTKRPHGASGWLPPLSLASLIGIALFVTYIGSAVISTLPFGSARGFSGVGALYTKAEEKMYCEQEGPAFDTCFSPPTPTNRTIYMQPYGGLGNRLRAVASALTIAREANANVVIVWLDKEYGFKGQWSDLFAAPRIPLGCFPGGALREDHARCTVRRVNTVSEWEQAKNKFEIVDGKEVLCMQSMMFLTEKQRGIGWFYHLLRPVERIASAVQEFQQRVRWDGAASNWVGVHIRRTDLRLKCNTDDCLDGVKAEDVLPLSKYTTLLEQIITMAHASGRSPRFFLATDDAATEAHVRSELKRFGNLTQANGGVVSYTKAVRDSASDSLAMRSNLAGMEEAVVDLWLLSQTHMLVGTVGSSYSQTAKLIGAPFFLSVGVEFENKMR